MARLPFFKFGSADEELAPARLTGYVPTLSLEGMQLGVDNLRHDVQLSHKFIEQTRWQISRLIARYGNMEGLLAAEASEGSSHRFVGAPPSAKGKPKVEPADLKQLLTEIHLSALNHAKADSTIAIDVLARVAVLKFLRAELGLQFAQLLERCRMVLKNYEGFRQQKAVEYRERVAAFQVAKKIVLRQTGQELFRTLREVEKETLARMRRSLFGNEREEEYMLFLNPLIFTEDGRDTYLNAEHYVMLGNFDRDPDRFDNIRRLATRFVQSSGFAAQVKDEAAIDAWFNVPENAHRLVGTGSVEEATLEGRSQKARLGVWVELLEQEGLLAYVAASYEAVPLLAEYSPRINAQQLKNALISREERERVEKLIAEHGKLSAASLTAAVARVAGSRGADRARMAGRFLSDFFRYHRDLRRLEALNAAMDSVNLISNEKLRELSALNGTLYEFLSADEQKPTEDKIARHVIIKADIRDSSRLTRSLLEREMNPASYFSLNFYDPVNKLLAKYGASKVFLEGDAIILALFEREGDPPLAVSKACVLAREMVEIVRGYNQLLERASLPTLELGLGISLQESAPMFLLDGQQRIMISDALNESDRLSSCNKRARKTIEKMHSLFNVYAFQTADEAEEGESAEDIVMKYNVSGIRISEAAFLRLQQEISLAPCQLAAQQRGASSSGELWDSKEFSVHSGLVPVDNGIFRKIVVRKSRMAQINPRDFSLLRWTDQFFYEVCTNPAIDAMLEAKAAAGK